MPDIEVGETYVVPETGKFFMVHEIRDDYIVTSSFCTYYDDAQTNINHQRVSYDLVDASVRVIAIDKIPGVIHNGIGWKHVIGEPDPAHPKRYTGL